MVQGNVGGGGSSRQVLANREGDKRNWVTPGNPESLGLVSGNTTGQESLRMSAFVSGAAAV